MPVDIRNYSVRMMELLDQSAAPASFLTGLLFKGEEIFDEEQVEFDLLQGGRALAPFVSPVVAGQVMRDAGFETRTFKPAYVKPKEVIGYQKLKRRIPGEPYNQPVNPSLRLAYHQIKAISKNRETIQNRLEWMAAQILTEGKMVIEGKDYPRAEVDFLRDATLDVALAGAAMWSDAASTPLSDIEDMAKTIYTKSKRRADLIIMDGVAWGHFKEHDDVKALLDLTVANGSHEGELGPLNFSEGLEVARLSGGQFRIVVYDALYQEEDANGDVVDRAFIPEGTAILVSSGGFEGMKLWGAIEDLDAINPAPGVEVASNDGRIMHKSWRTGDPAQETHLAQSAPLLAAKGVNTWGRLTVV